LYLLFILCSLVVRRLLKTENELIELVLKDVGLEYIPKCSMCVQKYYMRQKQGLYIGLHTSVQRFVEKLNDFNLYLLYFPGENPKQLDQANALDLDWHESMFNVNIEIFEMSYDESVSYFKLSENLEKIRHTNSPNPSSLPVDNKSIYICYQ
jgi:hypothetical protein